MMERISGVHPSDEYYVLNAVKIVENLHEYVPQQYPILGQALTEYCGQRIRNQRVPDPDLNMDLARWLFQVTRISQENSHNHSTLCWAAEKCTGAEMHDRAVKLAHRAAEFAELPSPKQDIDIASRVKRLDQAEKRRNTH